MQYTYESLYSAEESDVQTDPCVNTVSIVSLVWKLHEFLIYYYLNVTGQLQGLFQNGTPA